MIYSYCVVAVKGGVPQIARSGVCDSGNLYNRTRQHYSHQVTASLFVNLCPGSRNVSQHLTIIDDISQHIFHNATSQALLVSRLKVHSCIRPEAEEPVRSWQQQERTGLQGHRPYQPRALQEARRGATTPNVRPKRPDQCTVR